MVHLPPASHRVRLGGRRRATARLQGVALSLALSRAQPPLGGWGPSPFGIACLDLGPAPLVDCALARDPLAVLTSGCKRLKPVDRRGC